MDLMTMFKVYYFIPLYSTKHSTISIWWISFESAVTLWINLSSREKYKKKTVVGFDFGTAFDQLLETKKKTKNSPVDSVEAVTC